MHKVVVNKTEYEYEIRVADGLLAGGYIGYCQKGPTDKPLTTPVFYTEGQIPAAMAKAIRTEIRLSKQRELELQKLADWNAGRPRK